MNSPTRRGWGRGGIYGHSQAIRSGRIPGQRDQCAGVEIGLLRRDPGSEGPYGLSPTVKQRSGPGFVASVALYCGGNIPPTRPKAWRPQNLIAIPAAASGITRCCILCVPLGEIKIPHYQEQILTRPGGFKPEMLWLPKCSNSKHIDLF